MKIYITRGDQKAGPYNLAQINAFLNIGRLNPEDLAWYEGCNRWIKVKGIPGIKILNQVDEKNPPERPPVYAPSRTQDSIPTGKILPSDSLKTQASVSSKRSSIPTGKILLAPPPAPALRYDRQSDRSMKQYIYRTRIPCKICDSGELMKTRLYRFSFSIQLLGTILLFLSEAAIAGLLIALTPIDVSGGGIFIVNLKMHLRENIQFLSFIALTGIILYCLFHSKKHVLQCDHCESIIAVE